MDALDHFSGDYEESRRRFRDETEQAGFTLCPPQPIPGDPGAATAPLTIDAATLGPEDAAETVVVSSGLHGVEGLAGAAMQLAMLRAVAQRGLAAGQRIVMIHALNPFGFAHARRCDEAGVDLNRNFTTFAKGAVAVGEAATPEYRRLDRLLNPATPPRRPDLFYAAALAAIARYGMVTLKNALSTGQYAYPRGLWFGGTEPQALRRVLEGPLRDEDGSLVRESDGAQTKPVVDLWVGASPKLRWYDLHTGLGRFGAHRLFVQPGLGAERLAALQRRHGAETIVSTFDGVQAMPNRGLMRSWLAARYAERDTAVMTAEFGTYGPLKVLKALRAEQRAWLFGDRGGAHAWAAEALREAFAPASAIWRRTVVSGALRLFEQALAREPAHAGAAVRTGASA